MPEKKPSIASHYVPPLTGIRALAALLVLGLHTDLNVPADATVILPFLARGYLGVDFFFVLSGFIITHVYFASLAQPTRNAVQIFLWHRFIRLYPVHVTVLAALVVLVYLARVNHIPLNHPQEWRGAEIPWQLTLLHAWGVTAKPGWNAPSWSISAEWFAYLLFPLLAPALMLVRERLAALLIAIAALAGTAAIFSIADWSLNTWVGTPALARVLGEFLCGAALCRAVALSRRHARPCAGHPRLSYRGGRDVDGRDEPGQDDRELGAIRTKTAFSLRLPHPSGDLLGTTAFLLFLIGASAGLPDFGLVALLALTILGAATAETYLARILGSRPLVWLGEISYSIYMIHFPVLIVTRRLWERLGIAQWTPSGKAAAFALTVAMVIALAAMLYYAVERPARTRLRDQMGRLAPA
jgi:peptidoglycan/LPS O-acetylase OafA/YrhL